jgi:hypothetical protein
MAEPVIVDPLGSRAIGANVFPVAFLGRFATRPEPTGELNGRLTELPMCIPPPWPPRASANVLGTVNAIASAIVVYFMVISFTCEIGDDRTLTTKFFFRRAKGCSFGRRDRQTMRWARSSDQGCLFSTNIVQWHAAFAIWKR